jgi:hypothetical protein
MRGPAFSPFFKLFTCALVVALAFWFARLWLGGQAPGGTVSILTWFLAALAMLLYTAWHIVRGVTTLDAQQLQQTWVWHKKMDLRELAYGKLIRVRGLEWLVAPRLYVRTLMGKFAVFYCADPRMLAEFERLVAELKDFRGFK